MNATSKPKTAVNFQPLLDMNPVERDTILTSMCEAQLISEKAGQQFTIMTTDQQLYRIAVQLQWHEPERFGNMIIRLSGMHMLTSFLGCIGGLIKERV